MHCSTAARQLQFYIDRQLTLKQIRMLETHLSTCSACRQDLVHLETIGQAIHQMDFVREPADLTTKIMQRVALQTRQSERLQKERARSTFRLSLGEWISAALLATLAMVGIILTQPALRASLPIANGHDLLSHLFLTFWDSLSTTNSGTLLAALWVVGTAIGIWISLMLAGSEMRTQWLRAVMSRLPVW